MLRSRSSQCVFVGCVSLWAVCVCLCLWLRMLTAAEVPADDDREGQQRLRLPISGADRVSQCSQLFTPALAPAACPALKRGLRRIEQAICSLFLPLYCRVKLVFFKASTWGWSFWDYVPNTDSSTFILHVSPSCSAFISSSISHLSTFHLSSSLDILFTVTVFLQ